MRTGTTCLSPHIPAPVLTIQTVVGFPPILADGGQLQQVIVNLVSNARQAIGNDLGTITIGVSPASQRSNRRYSGDFVRLRVADTGCGMDAETMDRVFEPFFTTKKVGEGTGLGLSVVHGIIGDRGGHIEVRSRVGKGTEFIIFLPIAEAAALPIGAAAA